MTVAADAVTLTDLEIIQRWSLAVRQASADRAEIVAALRADLDWLEGGSRVEAADDVDDDVDDKADNAEPDEISAPRAAKRAAPRKTATRTATKSTAKSTQSRTGSRTASTRGTSPTRRSR